MSEASDYTYVIKIGGNIIDNELRLHQFLAQFAKIESRKVLVHGGGKLATQLAGKLNLPQQMVEGRRITDAETLKLVTMVYAGLINKTVVAQLQAHGCNAAGFSGADGNLIQAHKRVVKDGKDYGFAGDIDRVNAGFLSQLINKGVVPVLAPITHDRKGQLLNTNADTITNETASALSTIHPVRIIYVFEMPGVMSDPSDADSVIPEIGFEKFKSLQAAGTISGGMIPKLDNAFAALAAGVEQVLIGQAEDLEDILKGTKGTRIIHD